MERMLQIRNLGPILAQDLGFRVPSRPRIFSHSQRPPLPHHLQNLKAPFRSPPPHHFRSFRQSHPLSRLHRTRLRPRSRRSRRPRRCLEIPEPRPPSRRHRHSPQTRSSQGHGLCPAPLPLLITRPQRRRPRHATCCRLRPPSRQDCDEDELTDHWCALGKKSPPRLSNPPSASPPRPPGQKTPNQHSLIKIASLVFIGFSGRKEGKSG